MKLYEKLDTLEHFNEVLIVAKEENDFFKELQIIKDNDRWSFKYLIDEQWKSPLDFLDKRYIKTYKSWKSLLNRIKSDFDNVEIE